MAAMQNMSRKRPAPGTSPVNYPQQIQQMQNGYAGDFQPTLTDDQFLDWGQHAQTHNEAQTNSYLPSANVYGTQSLSQVPSSLAPGTMSQAVVRQPFQQNQWAVDANTAPAQQEPATTWSDDINELLEKAQVAKREAQSKRKQIPPFVLKLHSFLENPKNTDLIRWADDGKSFVVLNEDEFANKLIPELFKHNNYASFVRQLNMYGFHKKVGLSDNSMRASERKAKSPSEYWNPFFRQGYPDLLWLIQKPKNQTASSNKNKVRLKSEERDEEDEYVEDGNALDGTRGRPQLAIGQALNGQALTQEQFETVQRELAMIRKQQSQITYMLGQLKREHDALVNQASDYQNKHSRHENSINAILTFLATLYNRSLQNHEGTQAQDIAKMFASTLQSEKKDGNNFVFDVPHDATSDPMQRTRSRSRLLLTDGTENRAQTMSPATSAASPIPRASTRSSNATHAGASPQSVKVEEIFDPEANALHNDFVVPTQQSRDMMSLIHDTNARNSGPNSPVPDFSNVLNNLESTGGTTPISSAQRDDMLRMFQPSSSRPSSSSNAPNRRPPVTPLRSDSQRQFDAKLAITQNGLDDLARMQAAQDKSVENLTNLLQPLSPTGSIPGIHDGQDIPPPPLNIDDFLGANGDYFASFPTDGNPDNYEFPSMANNNGGVSAFDFNDEDPLFGNPAEDEYDEQKNNFLDASTYDTGISDRSGGRVESIASSSEAASTVDEHEEGRRVVKKRRKS